MIHFTAQILAGVFVGFGVLCLIAALVSIGYAIGFNRGKRLLGSRLRAVGSKLGNDL